MAVRTEYKYKNFNFMAYICVCNVNLSKNRVGYDVKIRYLVFNDAEKTNAVESRTIIYAIPNAESFSFASAYAEVKKIYPDSIDC